MREGGKSVHSAIEILQRGEAVIMQPLQMIIDTITGMALL